MLLVLVSLDTTEKKLMPIKTLTEIQKQKISEINYDFNSAEKETILKCDLCNNEMFTVIAQHDRYEHKTSALLCECGNCFLSPRLTEHSAEIFYKGHYRALISAWWGRNIDENGIQADQKIYISRLLDQLNLLKIDKTKIKKILDVGGSTGIMLSAVEQWVGRDCVLVNIDPAEKETNISLSQGIETRKEIIENTDLKTKFDFIMMCWAVDHLRSIKKSLKKIRSLMTNESYFWIDFADFEKLIKKQNSVEGVIKIDHNYYLTETTMEEYLSSTGFTVIRKIIAMDKWHIGYLCKKAKKKKLNFKKLNEEKKLLLKQIRNLNESFENENFK